MQHPNRDVSAATRVHSALARMSWKLQESPGGRAAAYLLATLSFACGVSGVAGRDGWSCISRVDGIHQPVTCPILGQGNLSLHSNKGNSLSSENNNSRGFRLDGKIAAITGGASGIGEAIARIFALQGAKVNILDIDAERAARVAKSIEGEAGSASAFPCDVSDMDDVRAAFQAIFGRGRLDVLVNCAGVPYVANLENTSEEDFDRIFRVNVRGVYNCMHACIGHMKSQAGGVILNISSIAATAGIADRFAYSMSKGAVLSMTLSVAKDYLPYGIRCNCISPARVHTPFVDQFIRRNYPGREKEIFEVLSRAQPVGRMAQPAEVASLALYLCCDEAAMLTGSDYPIDGGFFNLRD